MRFSIMPTEIFKIVAVAIIAFGLGTTYVNGRQTVEINRLNGQIEQLRNDANQASSKQRNAEDRLKRINQKVEQFYKSFKDGK